MELDLQAEIQNIDYSQIIFRQIDRIQALSSKDYQNENSKLFDFVWGVKLLRSLVPKSKEDAQFVKEVQAWDDERKGILKEKDFATEFNHVQELLSICINLFARKGILYKNVKHGSY